jgi:hypothetical protein
MSFFGEQSGLQSKSANNFSNKKLKKDGFQIMKDEDYELPYMTLDDTE